MMKNPNYGEHCNREEKLVDEKEASLQHKLKFYIHKSDKKILSFQKGKPTSVSSESRYRMQKREHKRPKRKNQESTRDRMLEWQSFYAKEDFGLWIECCECKKWRKVSKYKEGHAVPTNWFCSMNEDLTKSSCDVPQDDMSNVQLTSAEYIPGSIVVAKLQGHPWWPAMVEDDPDVEEYYWMNDDDDRITAYHVTFLDEKVSRAWIPVSFIQPYSATMRVTSVVRKHNQLLMYADLRAKEALKMTIEDRLKTYSFAHTFRGKFGSPLEIDESDSDFEDQMDEITMLERELDNIESLDSTSTVNGTEHSFLEVLKNYEKSMKLSSISNITKNKRVCVENVLSSSCEENSLLSPKIKMNISIAKDHKLQMGTQSVKNKKSDNMNTNSLKKIKMLNNSIEQNENYVKPSTTKSNLDIETNESTVVTGTKSKLPNTEAKKSKCTASKKKLDNTGTTKTKCEIQNNCPEKIVINSASKHSQNRIPAKDALENTETIDEKCDTENSPVKSLPKFSVAFSKNVSSGQKKLKNTEATNRKGKALNYTTSKSVTNDKYPQKIENSDLERNTEQVENSETVIEALTNKCNNITDMFHETTQDSKENNDEDDIKTGHDTGNTTQSEGENSSVTDPESANEGDLNDNATTPKKDVMEEYYHNMSTFFKDVKTHLKKVKKSQKSFRVKTSRGMKEFFRQKAESEDTNKTAQDEEESSEIDSEEQKRDGLEVIKKAKMSRTTSPIKSVSDIDGEEPNENNVGKKELKNKLEAKEDQKKSVNKSFRHPLKDNVVSLSNLNQKLKQNAIPSHTNNEVENNETKEITKKSTKKSSFVSVKKTNITKITKPVHVPKKQSSVAGKKDSKTKDKAEQKHKNSGKKIKKAFKPPRKNVTVVTAPTFTSERENPHLKAVESEKKSGSNDEDIDDSFASLAVEAINTIFDSKENSEKDVLSTEVQMDIILDKNLSQKLEAPVNTFSLDNGIENSSGSENSNPFDME